MFCYKIEVSNYIMLPRHLQRECEISIKTLTNANIFHNKLHPNFISSIIFQYDCIINQFNPAKNVKCHVHSFVDQTISKQSRQKHSLDMSRQFPLKLHFIDGWYQCLPPY